MSITQITLLKALKRGYFIETDADNLGDFISCEYKTFEQEIEDREQSQEPQIFTPKKPFTPEIKKNILKALKRGKFESSEIDAIIDFCGIGKHITVIGVLNRAQVEELDKLQDSRCL